MNTGLLTAGSGQGWENELVAALDRPGSPMTVLRRCVDIGEFGFVGTGRTLAVQEREDILGFYAPRVILAGLSTA